MVKEATKLINKQKGQKGNHSHTGPDLGQQRNMVDSGGVTFHPH